MTRGPLIPFALFFVGCAGTQTQFPQGLVVGARARVATTAEPTDTLVGTVLAIDERDLTLDTELEGNVRLPFDAIAQLSTKAGDKRHANVGALVGIAAGLTSFVIIDAAEGGCSSGESLCESGRSLGLIVLVGGGTLVGALFGAAVVTDQWEDHPLPLRMVLDGRQRRVTVGWSLRIGPAPGTGRRLR